MIAGPEPAGSRHGPDLAAPRGAATLSGTSMQQELFASPLVAGPAHLRRPAVVGATETWTWQQVHEASIALARRIRGASAVCNLCSSRLAFLITLLATLRNGSLMVLPPSSSDADIAAVLNAQPDTIVVGDAEQGVEPACQGALRQGVYVACRPEWKPGAASAGELAWQPAWDAVAVLLHTSGTTGDPQPQPKTLRQLAAGAVLLAARLAEQVEGGLGRVEHLVCSVPAQHMFGLECSVMLSLVHGTPVLDRRPLLPADVAAAFDEVKRAAWIATPMHLRSLARSGAALPACAFAIVSTMPLGHALALQAEPLLAAPVLEIYGSTETGALALRRTARETRWSPLGGVTLDPAEGATLARGAHFASPVELLDEIVVEANGSFTLLGRQADLIKIAGRRASLAGLNLLLQDLPGLGDGVFYLPPGGNPTERLCLIYAGPPLERAAARRWLRARLDPVFLPRDFVRLDRMPRSDAGKLRLHSLDLAYSNWQAARPQRATRSAATREGAMA
jgi:acyl-coenzyme A synthetase/AMP-(fatty) acid ligase